MYNITVNCKYDDVCKIDNKTIASNPIKELRKLLPEFEILRGNCWDWNITLWDKETNKHLYYIVITGGK